MKLNNWDLLLRSITESNTLPLTSRCNLKCVFCSNRQNSGAKVLTVKDRHAEEILEVAEFLDKEKPVIIGESATRFFEGEPFLYPGIIPVLTEIRRRYPETLIKITTNGELLDEKLLATLRSIGGIKLTVSVNCLGMKHRKKYLSARKSVSEILGRIEHSEIEYSLSSVIFPSPVSGVDSMKETTWGLLEYLKDYRKTTRLFFAGLTSRSLSRLGLGLKELDRANSEIVGLVHEFRKNCDYPIILEPYGIDDFTAVVEGVENSTGRILPGDRIISVNGNDVCCGQDAVKHYSQRGNDCVTVQSGINATVASLRLAPEEKPIFRMGLGKKIIKWLDDFTEENPDALILASEFSRKAFQKRYPNVIVPENRHFGGNIRCYGLISFNDIYETVRRLENSTGRKRISILSPSIMDSCGFDILGKTRFDYPGLDDSVVFPPGI